LIKKRILIIGATSTIAHECARSFNNKYKCFFTLIGRNQIELDKNKSDLLIRSKNSKVEIMSFKSFDQAFIDALNLKLRKPYDLYILAHGILIENDNLTMAKLSEANELNINSYANLIFLIYERLKKLNKGHLVLFGSVAGDRGKQSNFWYGASKAYINNIFQGIDHDISVYNRSINLSIIKPGPTLTKMTMHLPNAHKYAKVSDVASEIVKQIDLKKRVVYVPRRWRWIMLIIIHIPRFLFNKLKI
jgi:decaprenylphospho-beta-D-erythro-pentofuranosid-2-ulose 2-reductase